MRNEEILCSNDIDEFTRMKLIFDNDKEKLKGMFPELYYSILSFIDSKKESYRLYTWVYMSDIKDRLKCAKDYFEKTYSGRIQKRDEIGFYTENFRIMFIDCGTWNPTKIIADRAFIDYREAMIHIAKEITRFSRYTKETIVDDRKLGLSDNYKKGE